MNHRAVNRQTAVLLFAQFALFFVPIFVLGAAIDWPASLDEPISTLYPRLIQNLEAVRLGYGAYLAYSVLFLATAVMMARAVAGGDTLSPSLRVAAGFGIISALARTIGIVRWLSAMPLLATQYLDPTTSTATKEMITITHLAINELAGTIGEALGVGLFAALWALLIAIALLRMQGVARLLGSFGLVTAAALFTNIGGMFGIDIGIMIVLSVTIAQFWFLAMSIWLFVRK